MRGAAYSAASATSFNGFPNVYEIFYVTPRLMVGKETREEVQPLEASLHRVAIQDEVVA